MEDELDRGPGCNELVTHELASALRYVLLAFLCVCMYVRGGACASNCTHVLESHTFLPKNSNACLLLKDDPVTRGSHY